MVLYYYLLLVYYKLSLVRMNYGVLLSQTKKGHLHKIWDVLISWHVYCICLRKMFLIEVKNLNISFGDLFRLIVYTTLQHTYSIEYAILLMKKMNIIVKINH